MAYGHVLDFGAVITPVSKAADQAVELSRLAAALRGTRNRQDSGQPEPLDEIVGALI